MEGPLRPRPWGCKNLKVPGLAGRPARAPLLPSLSCGLEGDTGFPPEQSCPFEPRALTPQSVLLTTTTEPVLLGPI